MDLPNLRDALRRELRDHHVETEAIALRVLESEADGYAALLLALRALHLSARDDVFPEVVLRPRLQLLERDLTDLGVPLDASTPRLDLALQTPPELLGWLYVVEGSTLVGPTAARRVRALWKVLGRGTPPLRYLTSQGLDVSARWRAFVGCIDGFSAAHPAARDEVIAAAGRSLEALKGELCRRWPGASAGAAYL